VHLLPGLLLVLSTNLTYLWGGFRVEGRGAWWFGPMLFGVWVWGVVVYYFPLVLNYVPVPNRRLAGEPARTVLVKCRRLLEELLFAGRCITLASLEAFALIVWLKALTGGDVADMSQAAGTPPSARPRCGRPRSS